ncbi:MAG TPA: hypothetical protein VF802_01330, partial [Candidatus Limnocylindrales bacterium]
LVFIALLFVVRAASSGRKLTSAEAIANAMEVVSGEMDGPIDGRTRATALRLLAMADPADPLVPALHGWLAARPTERRVLSTADRLALAIERAYGRLSRRPAFGRVLAALMILDVAVTVLGTATLILALHEGTTEAGAVATAGQAVSAIVGGLLVLRGLPDLAGARVEALRWFRRGVLAWILVTQVFAFYASQLAAVGGLAAHVATYAALTYLIVQERARERVEERPRDVAAGALRWRP